MRSPLLRNTGILAALTSLSRVLGLVREAVLFALFGAGGSILMDAYQAAFRIPNMLRDLFAEGALSAAFVTTFAQTAETDGEEAAWRLGRQLITALAGVVAAITILGVLAAPLLIDLMAGGFEKIPDEQYSVSKHSLAVRLTRILWPFLLMMSLASVWMGMLNARNRFAAPAYGPVMFNLASILVGAPMAYLLDPSLGTRAVAVFACGTLLGGALQWLIQMPALRREGFRFRFALPWREGILNPAFKRVLRLMAPAVVGLAGVQINIFVNTHFASHMEHGSISWLAAAFRFVHLPIALFGAAVSTAAIPELSRAAARKDDAEFRALLKRALSFVAILCIPSACGLAIIGEPLTRLLFERGQFLPEDTLQTAAALRFYAIGLAAYAAIKVTAPALYALGDARRPALVSLFSVGVNCLMSWLLGVHLGLGHRGLALSVSTVAVVNLTLLLWAARQHIPRLLGASFARMLAKVVLASSAMSGAAWGALRWLSSVANGSALIEIAVLAAVVAISLAVYAAFCHALKLEEWNEVLQTLRRRFARKTPRA